MYLVSCEDGTGDVFYYEHTSSETAQEAAKNSASAGFKNVRVWLLTGTMVSETVHTFKRHVPAASVIARENGGSNVGE